MVFFILLSSVLFANFEAWIFHDSFLQAGLGSALAPVPGSVQPAKLPMAPLYRHPAPTKVRACFLLPKSTVTLQGTYCSALGSASSSARSRASRSMPKLSGVPLEGNNHPLDRLRPDKLPFNCPAAALSSTPNAAAGTSSNSPNSKEACILEHFLIRIIARVIPADAALLYHVHEHELEIIDADHAVAAASGLWSSRPDALMVTPCLAATPPYRPSTSAGRSSDGDTSTVPVRVFGTAIVLRNSSGRAGEIYCSGINNINMQLLEAPADD